MWHLSGCDFIMSGDQALRAGQIIRRLREFVARGDSERRSVFRIP
jgi:hypothetical protein